jgi:hypothetical protein
MPKENLLKKSREKYLSSWNGSVDDFNGFLRRHESRSGKGALIGRSDASNANAIGFMHSIGRRNDVQLLKPMKWKNNST